MCNNHQLADGRLEHRLSAGERAKLLFNYKCTLEQLARRLDNGSCEALARTLIVHLQIAPMVCGLTCRLERSNRVLNSNRLWLHLSASSSVQLHALYLAASFQKSNQSLCGSAIGICAEQPTWAQRIARLLLLRGSPISDHHAAHACQASSGKPARRRRARARLVCTN